MNQKTIKALRLASDVVGAVAWTILATMEKQSGWLVVCLIGLVLCIVSFITTLRSKAVTK